MASFGCNCARLASLVLLLVMCEAKLFAEGWYKQPSGNLTMLENMVRSFTKNAGVLDGLDRVPREVIVGSALVGVAISTLIWCCTTPREFKPKRRRKTD